MIMSVFKVTLYARPGNSSLESLEYIDHRAFIAWSIGVNDNGKLAFKKSKSPAMMDFIFG